MIIGTELAALNVFLLSTLNANSLLRHYFLLNNKGSSMPAGQENIGWSVIGMITLGRCNVKKLTED
jgi:hypothetical protein